MPTHHARNTGFPQADSLIEKENVASQPSTGLSEVKSAEASPSNPVAVHELAERIADFIPTADVLPSIDEETGEKSTREITPLANFVSVNRFFYQLTQPRHLASKLLLFTAQGKEEEVVNFFAMSPHLIRSLIVKNDVEDYSGRRFKNISAFQYAIGAKDWLEIENYWCYEVGMAQREVPAHIAQEYCRNDLPLRKEKRSFTEFEFPRTLDFDNWINNETELWFPLHKNHKLGYDFAIANFPREGKEVDGMWRQEWAGVGRSAPFVALRWLENLAGLLALCEVRAKQVIELGERLSKQVQQEVDLEAGKDNGMSYS